MQASETASRFEKHAHLMMMNLIDYQIKYNVRFFVQINRKKKYLFTEKKWRKQTNRKETRCVVVGTHTRRGRRREREGRRPPAHIHVHPSPRQLDISFGTCNAHEYALRVRQL